MSLAVHFSSAKHDWRTPEDLFARLHAQHRFTIDAAANESNHLLPRWYGPGGEREDATVGLWDSAERYFFNPEYGRMQVRWVEQAYAVMCSGGFAVGLLPSRTDTRLWHSWVWNRETQSPYLGVSVDFLKGRLTFQGAPAPAPFPSVLVTFDGRVWYGSK